MNIDEKIISCGREYHKDLIYKIAAILKSTRGEGLMEGIASVLVFIVLVSSVTMMIMFSLRVTGRATEDSRLMQADANAVLTRNHEIPGTAVGNAGAKMNLIIDGDTDAPISVDIRVITSGGFIAFEPATPTSVTPP